MELTWYRVVVYKCLQLHVCIHGHLSSVGRSEISVSSLQFVAQDAFDVLFLFYFGLISLDEGSL